MAAKISSLLPVLLLPVLLLSAVAATATAEADSKKVIVAAGFLVTCQSCGRVGTLDLAGATPLPAARVSITCRDHRRRVVLYKAATADDHGYVFAELYTTTMRGGYFDPAEACSVRLLASPDDGCAVTTDVNGGERGSALRYENTTVPGKYADMDVYVARPLAFRPGYCAPGHTTQSSD